MQLKKLAASGRFIGLKESSYSLPSIMEKLEAMQGRMTLYSGNDDMVYPLLALGAEGVISVVSNLAPRYMADMVQSYQQGDLAKSLDLQVKALPLVRALFSEVSPIPCKFAMEQMGLCGGELRLPLIPAGEGTRRQLLAAMKDLGL